MRIIEILALGLFLVLSFGCLEPGGTPQDNADISNAVTQEMCDQYGGNWHSGQCRCAGIAGFSCPPGWVCTDLEPEGAADAMGVCKRASQ